jgi:hypothetical protein
MFKNVALAALLGVSSYFSTTVASAQQSTLCGKVYNGAILGIAYECWNDATFLITQPNNTDANGWQYTADGGVKDNAGEEFDICGSAFHETATEIWYVLNSTMPFDTGFVAPNALNGSVTFGDVFLNLGNKNFVDAMNSGELYGIRFDAKNDASVPLGVYKNVRAADVSTQNLGPGGRSGYENIVFSAGGTPGYGDFPANMTYFPSPYGQGYNVILSGQFLGPVSLVTNNTLLNEGFDLNHFTCPHTVGFKFDKSLIIDVCGVVGGNGTSCLDCSGVACGDKTVDQCGVCGGNNLSCVDCHGVPNGEAQLDQCGVCGGNGSTCADCTGTPNGHSVFDECGVCGGNGSTCADCAGTPNGQAKKDQCGVCNGDGKSCLDCAGAPFGTTVLDRCEVCGGDGQSCLGCSDKDVTNDLFVLDGGSARQAKLLTKAAKELLRKSKLVSDRKFANDQIKAADKLHQRNWTLSWQIPQKIVSCTNTSFCVKFDNSATITEYNKNSNELFSRTNKTVARLRKVTGLKTAGKNIIKSANSELTKSLAVSNSIPATSSKCS